MSDRDRERARRLAEAEAENAALKARNAHLLEQVERSEWEMYQAERVADEVRTMYPARVYVPGDDPPDYDRRAPEVLVSVQTGAVYVLRWDGEWRPLHRSHTVIAWLEVLGDGPLIALEGRGIRDLIARVDDQERDLDAIRSLLWRFERWSCPFSQWSSAVRRRNGPVRFPAWTYNALRRVWAQTERERGTG